MNLEQLLEVFHKYLYLPDTGAVEVTLGAVAANRLPGDPVWSLLVGPPSSGKTEILSSLSLLDDIHEVSTITQAGLLSGSLGKGEGVTGGLLAEIGRFGIIACKDFTSILSASPDTRTTLMAALREIFDGSWVRRVGTRGGQTFAWSGKVGFVGGVTEVIDLHSSTIGTMGERFVFYRLPELDHKERLELGYASMRLTGNQTQMRGDLAKSVRTFLDGLAKSPELPELTAEQEHRLVLLADLATKCRSSVERSGHDREIELVPQAEALGRLQSELVQLGRGLTRIGVVPKRIDGLLTKVALDGMSKTRRAIVSYFADGIRTFAQPPVTWRTNFIFLIRRRTGHWRISLPMESSRNLGLPAPILGVPASGWSRGGLRSTTVQPFRASTSHRVVRRSCVS